MSLTHPRSLLPLISPVCTPPRQRPRPRRSNFLSSPSALQHRHHHRQPRHRRHYLSPAPAPPCARLRNRWCWRSRFSHFHRQHGERGECTACALKGQGFVLHRGDQVCGAERGGRSWVGSERWRKGGDHENERGRGMGLESCAGRLSAGKKHCGCKGEVRGGGLKFENN